jgi:pimeloyl-ACP methyl ester carboxylesterase
MPVEGVRSCREQLSRTADLTQYTSEIAVDDVDEVRAALGYEKLNVVGASYGTRTAQIYMRRHPSRVRTATLFGTVPNDARTPLDFARSAQNALDGLIAECTGDAACRKAFPRLREEIDQILKQTEKEPVRVNVIDPGTGRPLEVRLNRDGLAQTLRYMLYNTDRAAQLPLFVHLAARGDFRPLAETARAWGDYPWSDGYFLAITCAEDVPFIREEEIPAAVAGTFLGDFRIRRQQAACNAWSPARLGPEFLTPTVSDTPTLLLAGERDPVTPPRYTEAVLRHLRNGIQVVIPDGAHSNGGMKGSGDCEWRMMMKLIEAGTTEGFDSSCAARMERPAFALGMAPEMTLAAADLERLAGTYRESKGGFEARLEVFGGNRLRARYSDGTADLFVPTSPTRFRTASDGYNLVFRMERGRVVGMTMEQAGQPAGGEMKRVPAHDPSIALSPCDAQRLPTDALCGTYEVFENRAARSGRKIPLRIAVIPANVSKKEPDAITYFAGGPGESAVMDGIWIAEAIRARGPQTRDLLLVDLRGTGGSAPLECPELDGSQSIQGFLDDYMPVEQVRSCRERLSRTADLSQYTSEIAVDDFDEVRAALGYEKLNLIGPSYGSRTAQVYMRRHPSRVRTATLLGTLPNDARIPLDFARSAQNALDGLIAECAGDAACREAFPRLREEIAEILRRVEKEPVRVELTDPDTGEPLELRLGRNGLAQTLRYMLYNTNRVSQLPLFVHLAARGDFRPLAENARLFGTFLWADGYAFAIACAEDVAFIREEEIPAAVAGTFLGDFRIRRQQAACNAWSAARLSPDLLAPTVSDAPTLLIAGERDPVNPPSYAEQVLRHLRRGLLVVIPDGAHVNGGMKNRECQDDLMARFIEAGSTEKLDISCVARMERPAFALSLGEPEVTLAAADLEPLTGTYRESSGYEARLDVIGGNRLRARYSDGSADVLVATSATRFRAASGGYSLVFRMEGGRAAAVTFDQSGQPLGGEMQRVP